MLNGSHLSFLQKRLGFIEGRGKTNDKKNLSWFVMVYDLYHHKPREIFYLFTIRCYMTFFLRIILLSFKLIFPLNYEKKDIMNMKFYLPCF